MGSVQFYPYHRRVVVRPQTERSASARLSAVIWELSRQQCTQSKHPRFKAEAHRSLLLFSYDSSLGIQVVAAADRDGTEDSTQVGQRS